ncbi:MAG: hypothetical protein RL397_413 [Pseudomonadota bacterium]
MNDSASDPWSAWLVRSLGRPISLDDRVRAALHLLDWMGCAHLGSTSEMGRVLDQWSGMRASGTSWACGSNRGLPAAEATFWNGCLGSCHEMDDVHREAVVHPGDIVIPAALAVAQRENVEASALLDAIVVGYETAILLGLLADKGHYAHWYTTATAGVFGSAMATSRLLGLNTLQMQNALGLAGMQSSGVWQCRLEAGLAKQLATGHSAQAGLLAADLAAAGMTGPLAILEGALGWLKATSGNCDEPRARSLLQVTDDAPWRLHEVSFKPWSACRHVHPAIECALKLHAMGCAARDITQIALDTYSVALSFAHQRHPKTSHEAKFSLEHAVAWSLVHGSFGLEATAPANLNDPACSALRARVSLHVGAEQEAVYPRSFGACLRVLTKGSKAMTTEVVHVLGDPENPLSPGQLETKAIDLLLASGWARPRAEALVSVCRSLPYEKTLDSLWTCLAEKH